MKAVKTISLGQAEVVNGVPIPSVASNPGYALVKTSYVGVTHSDYLFTDLEFLFQKNITVGSEFSGEIVEVGEGCTRFSKGDKIAGCCFVGGAATPHAGAQAEYILVRGDAMFSVDAFGDAVGMDQAAGLGVAFSTVYHGLYYLLGLPLPGSQEATSDDAQVRRTVLIYGGTTNTGMIAIQYAKLSGYKVITTCSTRNFDYVRSLGADEAYDYHDTERCIEEIRGSVGDDLHYVLDCVGAFESRRISAAVMAKGGVFGAVSPWDFPRADVTSHFVRGNMVLGEDF
ncbi:NAD(P)-binding protein, partial [Thozetella sp. PMI_491]